MELSSNNIKAASYVTYVNENTTKAYCVVTITNEREYEEAIKIINSISLEQDMQGKTVHKDYSPVLDDFAAQIEALMVAFEKSNPDVKKNISRKNKLNERGLVSLVSLIFGIVLMVVYFAHPHSMSYATLLASLLLFVVSVSAFLDFRTKLSLGKR